MIPQLVSVIMRTKNRPLLLPRAIDSVLFQTYQKWELIIVNDGGDPEPVNQLIANRAETFKEKIIPIHNKTSLGMEAASNLGIKRSNGEYLIIHDDDDSWDHEFLTETVRHLETKKNGKTGGVVTQSFYVSERIENDFVSLLEKTLFNPSLKSISIPKMCQSNQFAPISFLYRRECLDKIGMYREDLPVLGDWDFNLRFLRHFMIDFIPKPLANYHIRPSIGDNPYSNTIIDGIDVHQKYDAQLRDEMLRQDLDSGSFGFGYFANMPTVIEERVKPLIGDNTPIIHLTIMSSLCARIRRDGHREIMIYGAGYYGWQLGLTAKILGIKILRYIDQNSKLWGTQMNDVRVCSLDEASKTGNHLYVIGSFGAADEIRKSIIDAYKSLPTPPIVYHPFESA